MLAIACAQHHVRPVHKCLHTLSVDTPLLLKITAPQFKISIHGLGEIAKTAGLAAPANTTENGTKKCILPNIIGLNLYPKCAKSIKLKLPIHKK